MEILIIDVPNTQAVYFTIYVNSGFRFAMRDGTDYYHMPHLLEHLVFEGSQGLPDSVKLASELFAGGSYANGSTDNYVNRFEYRCVHERLPKLIEIAFDMVYHPLLQESSVADEQEVVAREIEEQMGDYGFVASDTAYSSALPKSSYSLLEQREQLFNGPMDIKMIRRYHKKYFTAGNSRMVIVADLKKVSEKQLLLQLKRESSRLPTSARQSFPTFELAIPEWALVPVNAPDEISTLQTAILFVLPGRCSVRDYKVLSLLGMLLQSNENYSLYYHLRKQGLLYSLNVQPTMTQEMHGIELGFACDRQMYPTILLEIIAKLRDVADQGVDESVFTHVKQQVQGGISMGCETTVDYEGWYASSFIHDEPLESPEEIVVSLEDVTQVEVLDLLGRLLRDENMHLASMGGNPEEFRDMTAEIRELLDPDTDRTKDGVREQVDRLRVLAEEAAPVVTFLIRFGIVAIMTTLFVPVVSQIGSADKLTSLWVLAMNLQFYGFFVGVFLMTMIFIVSFFVRYARLAPFIFTAILLYIVTQWWMVSASTTDSKTSDTFLTSVAESIQIGVPAILLIMTLPATVRLIKKWFRRDTEQKDKDKRDKRFNPNNLKKSI